MLGRNGPNLAPLLGPVSGKEQPEVSLLSTSPLQWTLSVASGGRQPAAGGVISALHGCHGNVFKVCSLPEPAFQPQIKAKPKNPLPKTATGRLLISRENIKLSFKQDCRRIQNLA